MDPQLKTEKLSLATIILKIIKSGPTNLKFSGNSLQPNLYFYPKFRRQYMRIFVVAKKKFTYFLVLKKLIFDMFPYTLDQQISKRQALNQKFTQQELWYLLYQLLIGSTAFQKKRQKSGDIRPRNILINDMGHVSIINVLSFPDEITNYYKSLLLKVPTFLGTFQDIKAPEELAELENRAKYCKSDPVIAESFSIGLTIMDAALLFDSEELYDVKSVSFKNYLYNDNLVAFKSLNMSPFFIKTVLNMLEVKSFDRPSPGESLAILKPYEAEIIELQEFIPDRERSKTSLQEFQHTLR